MKNQLICAAAASFVATISPVALAGIDTGYIYVNSTAAELNALGFDDATGGTPISIVPGWCNGCYTGGEVPTTSLNAFIEMDVTYAPADAAYGMFVYMDISYTDPNFQLSDFEAVIESSDPEIDVMSAADAGTPWSPFTDWGIPENYTVFQWMPSEFDAGSTNPFETVALTFGWNFTGSNLMGGGFPGLIVNGVGAVPAPGALAILGLAGIATARRRRQS
jgi:MYXO-CTERM domain-containing protein